MMWGYEILDARVRDLREAGHRARHGVDGSTRPSAVDRLVRAARLAR